MFSPIKGEQFVTADHPLRKIRAVIDPTRIRPHWEPVSAETGRPSIPPEPLVLALRGGDRLGVTSDRAWVRELTGHLVLRGFGGRELAQQPGTTPHVRRTGSGA
jgi:transposase